MIVILHMKFVWWHIVNTSLSSISGVNGNIAICCCVTLPFGYSDNNTSDHFDSD